MKNHANISAILSIADFFKKYISFQVLGIPRDCCKFKTKMSSRNSLNPIWEETFELDVHLPDLAFIRFNVVDVTSNLTTAQRVVPVNRLRQVFYVIL